MASPLTTTALPYGLRDCKITPYTDAGGTVLGAASFDLPNMQTFSFSEAEEFNDLRGDDRTVTVKGSGSRVEWSLEAGGLSLRVWALFSGGSVIETGTTPSRKVVLRKLASGIRPWFRIEGQAISDSGGDVHAVVYRCRCNGTIDGTLADGEYWVSSISGMGLPILSDTFDLLYDLVQNETASAVPLVTVPNPTA